MHYLIKNNIVNHIMTFITDLIYRPEDYNRIKYNTINVNLNHNKF